MSSAGPPSAEGAALECPSCGRPAGRGTFCTKCGTTLVRTCAQCGAKGTAGTKFCNRCGTPTGVAATVPGDPGTRVRPPQPVVPPPDPGTSVRPPVEHPTSVRPQPQPQTSVRPSPGPAPTPPGWGAVPTAPVYGPPPPGWGAAPTAPAARGPGIARIAVPAAITAVVVAVIGVAVVSATREPSGNGETPPANFSPAPTASPVTFAFRDSAIGVSAEIPNGWKRKTTPKGAIAHFDVATSSTGTLEEAEIGVEFALEEGPDGDLNTAVLTRLEGQPTYRRVASGDTIIGGKPAFRHEFDYTLQGKPLRIIEYFVRRPTVSGKVVRIAAYAETSRQAQGLPVVQRILDSVRVED